VFEVPVRLSSKQKRMLEEFNASAGNENFPVAARERKTAEAFFTRRDALRKHADK